MTLLNRTQSEQKDGESHSVAPRFYSFLKLVLKCSAWLSFLNKVGRKEVEASQILLGISGKGTGPVSHSSSAAPSAVTDLNHGCV